MVAYAFLNNISIRVRLQIIHPCCGNRVIGSQNTCIPVVLIQLLQQYRHDSSPRDGSPTWRQSLIRDTHIWRRLCQCTICTGRICKVPERLGKKSMHNEIVHKGLAGSHDISSKTQLLPVWAIRLNAKKIAEKSMQCCRLYLIKKAV